MEAREKKQRKKKKKKKKKQGSSHEGRVYYDNTCLFSFSIWMDGLDL